MLKNFVRMPKALKWLTSLGLATALWPAVMLIPANSVRAFGVAEWWSSSAGWIAVCSLVPAPVSAVLMLRRLRLGTWLYVVGWITANVSMPLVALSRGAPTRNSLPSAALALLVLAALAFYLGMSKEVREYFQGPEAPSRQSEAK
jgi:hypothetical protein